MPDKEEAGAYGWLSRLKSRPLVAVIIVTFTVAVAVLKAPVELVEAFTKLARAVGYDPANEAENKRVMLHSFTLGKELGNMAWYQYVKEKTGQALPDDIQKDYETAVSNASSRATLLKLPANVGSLDLRARIYGFADTSNGFRSVEELIKQTAGAQAAKAFSVGFYSSTYFWRAQTKDFSADILLPFADELAVHLNKAQDAGFPVFEPPKMTGNASHDRIVVSSDILDWRSAVVDRLSK